MQLAVVAHRRVQNAAGADGRSRRAMEARVGVELRAHDRLAFRLADRSSWRHQYLLRRRAGRLHDRAIEFVITLEAERSGSALIAD
eukprot:2553935-Prymnesium_polylepis.1